MKKNHPTNDKPTLINSILKFRSKPLIRPGQGNQLSDNHSIQTRSNYSIAGTLLLLHTVLYLLADLLLQNLPELSSILYSDSIRSFAISGLATPRISDSFAGFNCDGCFSHKRFKRHW